jgi:hypothetical protein
LSDYHYQDSRLRARVLVVCLSLGMLASVVAMVGNWLQVEMPPPSADASDVMVESAWRRAASRFEIGVYVACILAFCSWTYTIVCNAHALAENQPKYTPGWAVGLHFVPGLNLWLPYVALRSAYDELAALGGRPVATWLLPTWWVLWLAANMVGTVTLYHVASAESMDALRRAARLDLARNACDFVLYITTIAVVSSVTGTALRARQGSSVEGDVRLATEPRMVGKA